jgi:hypothetical protein
MTIANAPLEAYFAALLSGATILGDCDVETVEIIHDNARLQPARMTKTPPPQRHYKKKLDGSMVTPSNHQNRWETATRIHVPKPCIPTRQVSVELCVSDDDDDDDVSDDWDDDATATDLSSSLGSSEHTKNSIESDDDSRVLATARWMTDCKLQSASPKCPQRLTRTDSYGSLTKQNSLHASPNVVIGRCT